MYCLKSENLILFLIHCTKRSNAIFIFIGRRFYYLLLLWRI